MDQNGENSNILPKDRPTAGKIAYDILSKESDPIDPIEFALQNTKDYMAVLFQTLEDGKKAFPFKDFYIIVNVKHERALQVVFRNLFELRQTCPPPFFDQHVYRFDHDKEELFLEWSLPDEKACWKIYENRNNMDPSQFELLRYVIAAHDGSLWKRMKQLNGEQWNSPLLEKH